MDENIKHNEKQNNIFAYVLGSAVLAIGALLVIPKVIGFLSEKLYRPDSFENEDDDWGPEIVKKEQESKDDGEL